MTLRRVLLVCDLDSQIFGALPLACAFAARGWRATFAIGSANALPKPLLERLKRDFEVVERPIGALPADDLTFAHEAVGVFARGSVLAIFRHLADLASRVTGRPRPALFCGFNGLVFEKFEEGIAWRLGYDVIGLNGPRDRDAFEDFVHATPFERQPCAIVGLKRRPDAPARPRALEAKSRKLFVFAEQVVVPRLAEERRALVALLARLAQASPGWDVVIKARTQPRGQTFHHQESHVSRLMPGAGERPANFTLSYEPLEALLDRADLFATISSTAVFDALDHGVPSLAASDFGLRNADGAHAFFASGLLARLGDLPSLDHAPIRAPDARWLDRMGYGAPHSPDALIDRLEAFDPSQPSPEGFVSFRAAVESAFGATERSASLCERWSALDASPAADGARAALEELAAGVGEALKAASGAPDDPVAAFSRKLGLYWVYKSVRARLGVPLG